MKYTRWTSSSAYLDEPFVTPPQIFAWEDPSVDLRALQNPLNTGRYAYPWFDANGFSFTFSFKDPQLHQVAMYCVDWEAQARGQTVTMFDADSSAMLATQLVSGFPGGTYMVWLLSG